MYGFKKKLSKRSKLLYLHYLASNKSGAFYILLKWRKESGNLFRPTPSFINNSNLLGFMT
jgi:hypothetical protein